MDAAARQLTLFAYKRQNTCWTNLALILLPFKSSLFFTITLKKGYSGVALYCKKKPNGN
jgi:exonuclease III